MKIATMSDLYDKLIPYAQATNPIDPELLDQIPYFASVFHDKALWPLLTKLSGQGGIALIELKKFRPGETIISKGQFDQMIYWIIAGSAHVINVIKKQKKIIHKTDIGECLGELGVLRGTPRTTDVVAGEHGATAIEIDWAIAEKEPELGKYFFHLLTMQLADKLDKAYCKHVKIIANAIDLINEKTSTLISQNKRMLRQLKQHGLQPEKLEDNEDEQALNYAIANIRESLELLKQQESKNNLNKMGTWFGESIKKQAS